MNRTRRDICKVPRSAGVPTWAMAAVLAAGLPVVHGQDAPSAAPQTSTGSQTAPKTPSSAQPATAPAAGSSSSAATSGNGQAPPAQSDPVCFKLTGHCVDSSKAGGTAAPKAGATTTKAGTQGKKLNLTAPDVSTVVPEQELKEPLPNETQVTEVQESQTVSVKTDEGVPPDVPQGLGAIWWAVVHPSQAWRILTPYD
jgi:hypothetical protein